MARLSRVFGTLGLAQRRGCAKKNAAGDDGGSYGHCGRARWPAMRPSFTRAARCPDGQGTSFAFSLTAPLFLLNESRVASQTHVATSQSVTGDVEALSCCANTVMGQGFLRLGRMHDGARGARHVFRDEWCNGEAEQTGQSPPPMARVTRLTCQSGAGTRNERGVREGPAL